MKGMTLCIVGTVASAMAAWGCAGDTPDDPRTTTDGEDDGTEGGAGGSIRFTTSAAGGTQGGECPAQTSSSAANHIVIAVRWPASLAIAAGEGELHVWTKADLTFAGDAITGTVRPCGSLNPALTKAAFVGGGQVQLEFPGAVWDAPSMPVFMVTGTNRGFDVGAELSVNRVASLVGLTMSDPLNGPWPANASEITAVDHDGDGQPGIRAVPRTNPPFSAPPLDLAGVLDPRGARADRVYLATRTVLALSGERESCTSARGTAQVTSVDSHIVGCRVKGGGICTAAQSDFIDASQPRLTAESATFEMVQVAKTATCADVRAALPAR